MVVWPVKYRRFLASTALQVIPKTPNGINELTTVSWTPFGEVKRRDNDFKLEIDRCPNGLSQPYESKKFSVDSLWGGW